jgi:hypothetical protein
VQEFSHSISQVEALEKELVDLFQKILDTQPETVQEAAAKIVFLSMMLLSSRHIESDVVAYEIYECSRFIHRAAQPAALPEEEAKMTR